MSQKIEEITMNYEDEGILLVKELDKVILSKGAWTTILFKYQEWSKAKGEYGVIKYSIRRYKKIKDRYVQQSKFNISNNKQAKMIADALYNWIEED
jgi:hypothetical protein